MAVRVNGINRVGPASGQGSLSSFRGCKVKSVSVDVKEIDTRCMFGLIPIYPWRGGDLKVIRVPYSSLSIWKFPSGDAPGPIRPRPTGSLFMWISCVINTRRHGVTRPGRHAADRGNERTCEYTVKQLRRVAAYYTLILHEEVKTSSCLFFSRNYQLYAILQDPYLSTQ